MSLASSCDSAGSGEIASLSADGLLVRTPLFARLFRSRRSVIELAHCPSEIVAYSQPVRQYRLKVGPFKGSIAVHRLKIERERCSVDHLAERRRLLKPFQYTESCGRPRASRRLACPLRSCFGGLQGRPRLTGRFQKCPRVACRLQSSIEFACPFRSSFGSLQRVPRLAARLIGPKDLLCPFGRRIAISLTVAHASQLCRPERWLRTGEKASLGLITKSPTIHHCRSRERSYGGVRPGSIKTCNIAPCQRLPANGRRLV